MTLKMLFSFGLIIGLLSPSNAFSASTKWQELGGGKARLIASKNPETDKISGLIEVRLDKGWKTYWRSPGNTGISPEFDFTKSYNFDLKKIGFPIPQWIILPDTSFYGYKKNVSFVFEAQSEAIETSIDLNIFIGICEEICVPATAQFSIPADALNSSDAKTDIAIILAKSKLPDAPGIELAPSSAIVRDKKLILAFNNIADENRQSLRLITELSGEWISDPIEPNSTAISPPIFEMRLPDKLHAKLDGTEKWRYTLLQHAPESDLVTRAVEGSFTAPIK